MTHGTRATYQTGCHCVPCRAAEATYRSQVRRLHARDRVPMGAYVPASEAARAIARLLIERYSKRQVARLAGLERRTLVLSTDQRVRLRTLLKVRRVTRMLLEDR